MDEKDRQFWDACAKGDFAAAKLLWSFGGVNHHAMDDFAFQFACLHGHLGTAQWLWSLGGVNQHA